MTEILTFHRGHWLECSEKHLNATHEERNRCANGVGPDWFPSWLRWFLGLKWFMFGISIIPSADIHDFDCATAETERDVLEANDRMWRNLVRQIQQERAKQSRVIRWVISMLPGFASRKAEFLHSILVRYARMIRISTITLVIDAGCVRSWMAYRRKQATEDVTGEG